VELDISPWPTPEKTLPPIFAPIPSPVPNAPRQAPPNSKHYWPPPPAPALRTSTPRVAPPSLPPPPPKLASVLAFDSKASAKPSRRDYVASETAQTIPIQAPTMTPTYLMEHTEAGPQLRTVSTPADLAVFIRFLSSIPH